MSNIIKFKRGLDANIPVTGLNIGEPLYSSDTERFFICKSSTEKIEFGKRSLFLEIRSMLIQWLKKWQLFWGN